MMLMHICLGLSMRVSLEKAFAGESFANGPLLRAFGIASASGAAASPLSRTWLTLGAAYLSVAWPSSKRPHRMSWKRRMDSATGRSRQGLGRRSSLHCGGTQRGIQVVVESNVLCNSFAVHGATPALQHTK